MPTPRPTFQHNKSKTKQACFFFLTCMLYGHMLFPLLPLLCHTWDVPMLIWNWFWLILNVLLILAIGVLITMDKLQLLSTVSLHFPLTFWSPHLSYPFACHPMHLVNMGNWTISEFQLLRYCEFWSYLIFLFLFTCSSSPPITRILGLIQFDPPDKLWLHFISTPGIIQTSSCMPSSPPPVCTQFLTSWADLTIILLVSKQENLARKKIISSVVPLQISIMSSVIQLFLNAK